jgi:hypothetical protein
VIRQPSNDGLGEHPKGGVGQEVDAGHKEHKWFEYAAQARSPLKTNRDRRIGCTD